MNEIRALWLDREKQTQVNDIGPPVIPQRACRPKLQKDAFVTAPPIPPRPPKSILRQSNLEFAKPRQQFFTPCSNNEYSSRGPENQTNRPLMVSKIQVSQPVLMALNQLNERRKMAVNPPSSGPIFLSKQPNMGLDVQGSKNLVDTFEKSDKTGQRSPGHAFTCGPQAGHEILTYKQTTARPEGLSHRPEATVAGDQTISRPDNNPECLHVHVNQIKLKFQATAFEPLQGLQNSSMEPGKLTHGPSPHQPRRKPLGYSILSLYATHDPNVSLLRQQRLSQFNAKRTMLDPLKTTDSGPSRESVVRELFPDDSFHLSVLSRIVQSCRSLLTAEAEDSAASLSALGLKRQPICSQAVADLLVEAFFRFDALLAGQERFVTTLNARLESWTLSSCIGDLYLSLIEDAALAEYANHLPVSRLAAQRLDNMPEFSAAFKIASSGGTPDRPVLMGRSPLELQRSEEISLVDLVGLPARWLVTHAENCKMLAQVTPANHPDAEHLDAFCQRLQVVFNEDIANSGRRRLLKQQLVVELVRDKRKLRRLLLFNDVLVCASQRAGGNCQQDWVLHEKWQIGKGSGVATVANAVAAAALSRFGDEVPAPVAGQQAVKAEARRRQEEDALKLQIAEQQREIQQLKTGDSATRRLLESAEEKIRQLEAQLMLVVPNVELRLSQGQDKKRFVLLLSSDLDRREWEQLISDTLMPSETDDSEGHPAPVTKAELKDLLQAYSHLTRDTADLLKRLPRKSCQEPSLLLGTLCVTLHKLDVEDCRQPGVFRYSVATELKDLGRHFMRVHATKFITPEAGEVAINCAFQLELSGSESDIRFLVCRHASDSNQRSDIGCLELHLSKRDLRGYEYIAKCHYLSPSLLLTLSLDYAPLQFSIKASQTHAKQRNHLPVFGTPLDLLIRAEKSLMIHRKGSQSQLALSTPGVPMLVQALVQRINQSLNEEGLYRVSGSHVDLQAARDRIDSDGPGLPSHIAPDADVSLHTGLLKLFFRSLPDPLFTAGLHKDLTAAAEADDENLLKLLPRGRLPEANACTLRYLLGHLQKVSDNCRVNHMTASNLSLILGPTLIQPQVQNGSGGGGGGGGGDVGDISQFARQSQCQGKVFMRLMKLHNEGRLILL